MSDPLAAGDLLARSGAFLKAVADVTSATTEINQWLLTSKESAERKRNAMDILKSITLKVQDMSNLFNIIQTETTLVNKLDQLRQDVVSGRVEPPTYASTTAKPTNRVKIPGGKNITPPKVTRVIVRPTTEGGELYQTSDDTKNAILGRIQPPGLRLQISRIVRANNNSVIIESQNSNVNQLVDSPLLSKVGLKCQKLDNFKPRMKIYDVPKSLTPEQVKDALVSQNLDSHLVDDMDITMVTSLEPKRNLFKPRSDRLSSVNWVIEVTPSIRKILLQDKVYIGWNRCRIIDHLRITRCFNCQKYGHNAKVCKSETACGKCAKHHSTRDCPDDKTKLRQCANCIRSKLSGNNIAHTTYDSKCPSYIRQVTELTAKTTYEE